MASSIAVIILAVLNLIPAGVNTFTLGMPGNKPQICFTKQADGGWQGVPTGDKVRKEETVTFYVSGTKMTAKDQEGKEISAQDLGPLFGIDEKTDWSKLKEIKFGRQTMVIDRKDNGLDFTMKTAADDKEAKPAFTARWQVKDKKAVLPAATPQP